MGIINFQDPIMLTGFLETLRQEQKEDDNLKVDVVIDTKQVFLKAWTFNKEGNVVSCTKCITLLELKLARIDLLVRTLNKCIASLKGGIPT